VFVQDHFGAFYDPRRPDAAKTEMEPAGLVLWVSVPASCVSENS
jgi:hypothetical protein